MTNKRKTQCKPVICNPETCMHKIKSKTKQNAGSYALHQTLFWINIWSVIEQPSYIHLQIQYNASLNIQITHKQNIELRVYIPMSDSPNKQKYNTQKNYPIQKIQNIWNSTIKN